MAVHEHIVLPMYKDQNGDTHLLYAITNVDCIDGLEELLATITTHEHSNKEVLDKIASTVDIYTQADEPVDAIDGSIWFNTGNADGTISILVRRNGSWEISSDGVAQVQPDWEQTDASNPGYVRNKPFGYTSDLYANSTLPFAVGTNNNNIYSASLPTDLLSSLQEGEKVTVVWDGTVYELTAKNAQISDFLKCSNLLGNGRIISESYGVNLAVDSGEPFAIIPAFNTIYTRSTMSTHSLQIKDDETIIKIDAKFLPDEALKSPVKGIDYFTEADKAEMAQAASELVEIPDSVDYVVQSTAPTDTSVLWIDPSDDSGEYPQEAVLFSKQSLTPEQQSQAQKNIGIVKEVGKTSISNNLCDGVYEWGSLGSSGNESSLSPENYGFRTANFLPVEGGRKVLWSRDGTVYNGTQLYCICEYDVNKNLVLRTKAISHCLNKWDTAKAVTLNANTKYVRFYIYNGETVVDLDALRINLFYVENIEEFFTGDGDDFVYVPHIKVEVAGEYIPLAKIQSPLTGKKIVYDGDSIAESRLTYAYNGGSYAKLIADKVGGSYVNQAVGGGRLVTCPADKTWHSVVDNLPNLPKDGDLYCFEGGINDYWTPCTLGTYDYDNFDGELDITTVCGALETIFRYCLNNFVGKPVCFVITHKIQKTAYMDNINGDSFKDYHDAMVGICEKYSIPYYDAFDESGLNGWNTVQNNTYLTANTDGTPDGCHPNEEAYKRYYVPQLISLFESIMPDTVTQQPID